MEKKSLSYNAFSMIREYLIYSGEKISQKQKDGSTIEVNTQRILGGEKSSQRRQFIKAFDKKKEDIIEELKEFATPLCLRKEEEESDAYKTRLLEFIDSNNDDMKKKRAEITVRVIELEFIQDVWDTIKWCIESYEKEIGWTDQEYVYIEEMQSVL